MIFWSWVQRGGGVLSKLSATETGVRLGDLIWRRGESHKDTQLGYLLPCSELPMSSCRNTYRSLGLAGMIQGKSIE